MSTAEEGGNTAAYYDWQDDTMMSINTVALSAAADSLKSRLLQLFGEQLPGSLCQQLPAGGQLQFGDRCA